MLYFMVLETKKFLILKCKEWISDYWSWIYMISVVLNISFICCDLSKASPNEYRFLGAVAVGFMWLKIFY
jgi:hypothetical protein